MEEHFVNYNQALALKELGFDEPCIGNYFHTKELKIYGGDISRIKNSDMGIVTAPLKQQVFKFLYICSKGEINITYKASDCEDTINNKIDNGIKKLRNIQNNKS
jgi:hypothetical protein